MPQRRVPPHRTSRFAQTHTPQCVTQRVMGIPREPTTLTVKPLDLENVETKQVTRIYWLDWARAVAISLGDLLPLHAGLWFSWRSATTRQSACSRCRPSTLCCGVVVVVVCSAPWCATCHSASQETYTHTNQNMCDPRRHRSEARKT